MVTAGTVTSSFSEAPGIDPVRATVFITFSYLNVRILIGGARAVEIQLDNLVKIKSNDLDVTFR